MLALGRHRLWLLAYQLVQAFWLVVGYLLALAYLSVGVCRLASRIASRKILLWLNWLLQL